MPPAEKKSEKQILHKLEEFATVRYPDWIANLQKEKALERLRGVMTSSKPQMKNHDDTEPGSADT
ncbi:hypothetical protein C0995_006047 [Termitomyces sp. Mi166|nr:hypothetical protein C0995_006047 [Termitomyces sp. Mi166\